MKSRRVLSLLAVAALATTVFVGCGKKEADGLKDGTYSKKTEVNDKGYISSIEIEVKDGKIANVKYDETKDGASKLDDAGYNENMKAKSGTNPQEAFPALEKALVEKQDVAAVDAVTGATHTSESFKTLAEKALADAK